jgi:hypothetical protein
LIVRKGDEVGLNGSVQPALIKKDSCSEALPYSEESRKSYFEDSGFLLLSMSFPNYHSVCGDGRKPNTFP